MKSIFLFPKIQVSGTNDRINWISDKIKPLLSRPILILAILWVFYTLIDGGLTYFNNLPSPGPFFVIITVLFGFAVSCVYFFWLIPSIFYVKNPYGVMGISFIYIFVLSLLKYFVLIRWVDSTLSPGIYFNEEVLRQLAFFSFTLMIWGFYALIKALQEKRKAEATLDILHIDHKSAQLSPHFTLNLIGGIATNATHNCPEIAKDLDHFVSLLRYAYINPEKFNSLSNEINAIFSYLHCQKIRFRENLFLEEKINPRLLELNEYYLPKMLLLTLVENIFKHGDYRDVENPVLLEADWNEDDPQVPVFCFHARNKIQKSLNIKKSGFGIEAIRRILSFYFPKALVDTSIKDNWYSLKLSIPYEGFNQNWPNRR